MSVLARLRSFPTTAIHRKRYEDALDNEIRFHLDAYAADLVRSGLPAWEARRQAFLRFGSPEHMKDACRRARGLRRVHRLGRAVDSVRLAVRTLCTTPCRSQTTRGRESAGAPHTTSARVPAVDPPPDTGGRATPGGQPPARLAARSHTSPSRSAASRRGPHPDSPPPGLHAPAQHPLRQEVTRMDLAEPSRRRPNTTRNGKPGSPPTGGFPGRLRRTASRARPSVRCALVAASADALRVAVLLLAALAALPSFVQAQNVYISNAGQGDRLELRSRHYSQSATIHDRQPIRRLLVRSGRTRFDSGRDRQRGYSKRLVGFP